MTSLPSTLKQIADILSFSSNSVLLRDALMKETMDWEAIVKVASLHLVLPTVFCRLKQKSLIDVLPLDLRVYLKELTSINRNRNKTLLAEIHNISKLFNHHNINHVFLKGSALLAANYYKDIGERMIGDIDILVHINDLDTAYNLLITNKHTPLPETLGQQYFEHKHLPRLIPETGLGAIELHKKLLSKPHFNVLNSDNVLKSKQLINNIYIPSSLYLLRHNVLNFQINDKAYFYTMLGLRSAYDTILLLKQHHEINFEQELLDSYFNKYVLLISIFFKDIPKIPSTSKNNFQKYFFLLQIKHLHLKKVCHTILNYYLYCMLLMERSYLFLTNCNYRKAIIKDRHRILKIIKPK